tara:strand:- start:10639 stop:10788 length:150 start_codon:yes stop_codon:yes gene_type:complete
MKKALCMICKNKVAIDNCGLCGTLVCKDHYKDGLCVDCRRGKTVDEFSQ